MEAALSTALALSPNQLFNALNPGTIPSPLSNYVPFFSLPYCTNSSYL